MPELSYSTYKPSHPWYYRLGGSVLSPRQILNHVNSDNYKGYNQDIIRANNLAEPQRSEKLREIHGNAMITQKLDIARYRKVAFKLKMARKQGLPVWNESINDNPCVNLSLVYSHLYNNFARLNLLDRKLKEQQDLFAF